MKIKFGDLIEVYRALEPPNGTSATLRLSAELKKKLAAIQDDEEALEDSGLEFDRIIADADLYDDVTVTVSHPRIGLGVLASSLDEYLLRPNARLKESEFYLKNKRYYSKDPQPPQEISGYRNILRLISILEQCAHYLDEKRESLIFYKNGRFEIPIQYNEVDALTINEPALLGLENFLEGKLHETQKKSLLAETIVGTTESIEIENRLSHIISNVKEILAKTQAGYDIFSTDFTFEKAQEEVHSFKLEVTTRTHKAISEIQTQLLGIPLASFIALSQLKRTDQLNAQFASNSIILLGVLLFCFLLFVLLVNQNLTIKTIESDIDRQEEKFSKKFKLTPEAYTPTITVVRSRVGLQHIIISGLQALIGIVGLTSLMYYVIHTRPIYNALFS